MTYGQLSDDEAEVFHDLAERAGRIAQRLLADRGLVHLDDLTPEVSQAVLHEAWQEAAQSYFGLSKAERLRFVIAELVERLIMEVEDPQLSSAIVH